MNIQPLLEASLMVQLHFATVVPAAFIGAVQFLMVKGSAGHRIAGYLFMVLMLATSVFAFFIPSYQGGRFSFIHLFIIVTVAGIVRAWFAIRGGDVRSHAWALAGVYFGAVLIAGYFTFLPGRTMHDMFIATSEAASVTRK